MVELTKSFEQYLWANYKDIFPLIMFGHTELVTDEIWNNYIEWCKTEEGKKWLVGGEEYKGND